MYTVLNVPTFTTLQYQIISHIWISLGVTIFFSCKCYSFFECDLEQQAG